MNNKIKHKSLSLAVLLLPLFGYGITKKERIAELKEAQYQKALEFHSLSVRFTKIAATYYRHEEYCNFMDIAIDNAGKTEEALKKENADFERDLLAVILEHKPLRTDISEELFHADGSPDAFRQLYMQAVSEKYLLILLSERLKQCLEELLVINKELKSL